MFSSKHIVWIFSAILFACGSGSQDNNKDNAVTDKDPEIEVGEDVQMTNSKDFLISANMNSQLQIELSKAAESQSSSPEVQALSRQILDENKLIQNNILALSEAAGIDMAPALSLEYVALLDSIQSYSGDSFDSAFVATIIEEHEEDIDNFTRLSQEANNPIVRKQITDNLELLGRHLQAARDIQKEINN